MYIKPVGVGWLLLLVMLTACGQNITQGITDPKKAAGSQPNAQTFII
jgi:hypothetical protein